MRILPDVVKRGTVACHSSRCGAPIKAIVIHDTEGGNIPNSSRDLLGIYNFFDNIATQASAHACADNDGKSVQMVPDELKAWHVETYNPITLGIEMCHKQGEPYTDALYHEVARWVAWWSRKHNIPIRRAIVLGGGVVRTGVTMHRKLGSLGGGHHDPIPPWKQWKLLRLARKYRRLQQKNHNI